jgi:hypothetical protein
MRTTPRIAHPNYRWDITHQQLFEQNLHLPIQDLADLLGFTKSRISQKKREYREKLKWADKENKRMLHLNQYTNENIHSIQDRAERIIAEFENNKKK